MKTLDNASPRACTAVSLAVALALLASSPALLFAQYSPTYRPLQSGSVVQDKAFYLLTVMQQDERVRHVLANDETLRSILQKNQNTLAEAIPLKLTAQQGGWDSRNVTRSDLEWSPYKAAEQLTFSENEIDSIQDVLLQHLKRDAALQKMMGDHIRPSGKFERDAGLPDDSLLARAWRITARGINHIIGVYALGEKGLYPAIDSATFAVQGDYYKSVLQDLIAGMAGSTREGNPELFFEPSLTFSLQLLELNDRDEAARFEPLRALENRKAYEHIPTIDWAKYPYAAILVPGQGPQIRRLALDPIAKLRAELAANRFRQGKAPFLVLSGGYVHPFQTPFNEAQEMKKYLMEEFGIPERAILIEPHARHTTTNFRNTARLMFDYGFPTDKMSLVTTTIRQSFYISSRRLSERSERELGYVPYTLFERISRNDVEFKPRVESFQANPIDPLDP